MTSIGERLRRQRLQNRISLEKISVETKIGVRLLEAIESEQFEKLPGGVFRRSFVLQYARALGVDPEEIAAELKQLNQFDDIPETPAAQIQPDRNRGPRLGFPLSGDIGGVSGSTLGSLIAAVGVMLACALIYSWWQQPRETRPASKVATATHQPPKQVASQPVPVPMQADTAPPSPAESPQPAQPDAAAPLRVGLSAD